MHFLWLLLFRYGARGQVPGYFTLMVTRLNLPYAIVVRLHVH